LHKVQGIPPSWWFPAVTNGFLSLVTVTLVATAPVARFGLESRYQLRAVLQAFLRFWVRVSFFIVAVFGIGNLPLSPCISTELTLIPTSWYSLSRYFGRKNRWTASDSRYIYMYIGYVGGAYEYIEGNDNLIRWISATAGKCHFSLRSSIDARINCNTVLDIVEH